MRKTNGNAWYARAGVALVAGLALLVAGCLQVKDTYTINPDGSGKVAFQHTVPLMQMAMGQTDKGGAEAAARQILKRTIDGSKGVETWSDLSCETIDDGQRAVLSGTAYYPDISKMQWGEMDKAFQPRWTKLRKGGYLFRLDEPDAVRQKQSAAKKNPPKLTDAEVDEMIQKTRQQYGKSRPMMGMFFNNMVIRMAFRLPGEIERFKNFEKGEAPNEMVVQYKGEDLQKAMDAMMQDEATLREKIKAGLDPQKDGGGLKEMNEKLLGEKSLSKAQVSPEAAPQFDYAAEVAAAKKEYDAMIRELGLDKLGGPAAAFPPGAGEAPSKEEMEKMRQKAREMLKKARGNKDLESQVKDLLKKVPNQ